MNQFLVTGAAALIFAATFLFGGRRIRPLSFILKDSRGMLSFGAGMSVAYVFVHLMPELCDARRSFTESVSIPLLYQGMAVYLVAMIGFLLFYGLHDLRRRLGNAAGESGEGPAFRLHLAGLAVYVWMMSYLLVRNLEEEPLSTVMYTIAIACHFMSLDYSLRIDHGAEYDRFGRPLLGAMCLLGWGVGQLVPMPRYVLSLLVAFVSGSIIMNNSIMELSAEREGRFLPFLAGGLIYGLILVPLG